MAPEITQATSQSFNPLVYTIIGGLFGATVTVFLNGIKENYFLKKNNIKEEKIRALNKKQNEDDLIRCMSAKLVGLHYSFLAALKMYNEKVITHHLYHQMSEVEKTDKILQKFYLDESIAYLNLSDSKYEKVIDILKQYSEILGEFIYIIPESKVINLYTELTSLQFYKVFDFKPYKNFDEMRKYRDDIILEYNSKDLLLISKKSVAVIDMVHVEGKEKFKNSL